MSLFGTTSPFQQQQQQQQALLQQMALQQQQQQQQQMAASQQQVLLVAKGSDPAKPFQPASYNTKFEDLHPQSQQILKQIEDRVHEYRDESDRLEQCERLYKASTFRLESREEANAMRQTLHGISTNIAAETANLSPLLQRTQRLMRQTEHVVRSFTILRSRYPHLITGGPQANGGAPGGPSPAQGFGQAGANGGGLRGYYEMPQVQEFYSGMHVLPDPFLQESIAMLEGQIRECMEKVEEMERLLLVTTRREETGRGDVGSLEEVLPSVMSNTYEFFIHVAAQVEGLHQQIESARCAFLAFRRRHGDDRDPFLEADRQEAFTKAALLRAAHPGLQAGLPGATPTPSQPQPTVAAQPPTTSTGGLFGFSKPAAGPSSSSSPSPFSFAFPSASAPVAGATSTSAAAPSTSLFGATAATGSSLFGTGGSTPASATTTPATSSLFQPFGSMPAATSGGSIFGSNAAAAPGSSAPSIFGTPPSSTPAFGGATSGATGGTNLFSAPPAAATGGAATGSLFPPSTPLQLSVPSGGVSGGAFGFGGTSAPPRMNKTRSGRRK
eukprot:TRINITY_DN583_c0_g2_i2.p1 TRINITY_DN583_c0_g2~~TRINITY_DN583_c0_g2_i2.p1  ORF type:complete len:555 (-),score=122.81 TRINITY_DN583_c0_g2_i2:25-1689(-)